jgi:RNA polymerase sigma-70 factor (ECF subfamily)
VGRRSTTPATVPTELIDDARRGDQRAFEALFGAYQPGLLRYLRGVSPDLAVDVASATWESVVSSIGRFSGDGTDFRRWLFTIARRRLVDEVRRDTRRPLKLAEVPDVADDAPGPDAVAERSGWVGEILGQIPTRQADAVSLRVLGALSVDEVATLLGVTPGNVRVLSHRGVQAMQRVIEGDTDDESEEFRRISALP